ncbi:MAG: glycosyltransferase family 2 protein [Prochlorococcus sp.]
MLIFTWISIFLSAGAVLGLLVMLLGLMRVFAHAPILRALPIELGKAPTMAASPDTELTIVVPAYNEEINITGCLARLFASSPPCMSWKVLLVDDGSTDDTVKLAKQVAPAATDRFALLTAGPRPQGERWVGKNWACARAMQQVNSDWVLFMDADVHLQPDTLQRALSQAIEEEADLLSLVPRITCGCLSEWMVQPIMACLLALGFPIKAANDPHDATAFAAGPFMLFRRSTYQAIGGHRAVAGVVVEDLALARRVKSSGFRLLYLLGLDALQLRMYANFSALWEGWSKNWFLGLDRSLIRALSASAVVFWLFASPWLLFFSVAIGSILLPLDGQMLLTLPLSILAVALQFLLRVWTRWKFQVPLKNWWLMGAGGILIGLLGPTSVWRTLTGRGWTWKGRSLA